MSEERLLRTRDLGIGHGRDSVLYEGLNLEIRSGELICLLGPNGSGKSTLLRTLTGLLPSTSGSIEVLGDPLDSLTPRTLARRLAPVLPGRVRVGLLSVRALAALGRQPHTDWTGRLSAEDREVVEEALRAAGLSELADRDVTTLSDGEHQRTLIARALAQGSRLLLLDEPTAFLDLPGRVEILALLRTLAHSQGVAGRAVLLSTHDLDLALRMADRLWVLSDERLVDGTPAELAQGDTLLRVFSGRGDGLAREIIAEMLHSATSSQDDSSA